MEALHESVLLEEVCEFLQIQPGNTVLDATLGLGGHSSVIAEKIGKIGTLLAFEQDERNLTEAKKRLADATSSVQIFHTNFEHIAETFDEAGIESIDSALFDLGISSPHVDDAERGFSFMKEGPLDMRFDQRQWLTAREVVNKYSEQKLADIFYYLGEERYGRKIAAKIVTARRKQPLETTTELADLIASCKPADGKKRIHPATQCFQAIRMEVNRELEVLVKGISAAFDRLKSGGRLAVISFHSLEDRKVKKLFKHFAGRRNRDDNPFEDLETRGTIITKKPVTAGDEEIQKNPRARSAKLRVIEKI